MLSSADATTLTSLLQSTQASESSDEDEALGAPNPEAYKYDRGDIIGTLEDLLEKAETQLQKIRETETKNRHNYQLLKQSLDDEIAADQKNMARAKRNVAASEEAKAGLEGDLASTSADLKEDQATLARLSQDCKNGRLDHEADTKSRSVELEALAAAKKVLVEEGTYTAAVVHTYDGRSATAFLQLSRSDLASSTDLVKFEAVRFVRDLAKKEHSTALAQLASKMGSII